MKANWRLSQKPEPSKLGDTDFSPMVMLPVESRPPGVGADLELPALGRLLLGRHGQRRGQKENRDENRSIRLFHVFAFQSMSNSSS